MRVLRDVPIKRKLTIITMLTSGVSLLLACLIFAVFDLTGLRNSMLTDLATTASIIGDNSAAALSFNDPESAKQTLKSLTTHPHIVGAAIYDKTGRAFATYRSPTFDQSFVPPSVEPDGYRSDPDFIRQFSTINLAGESIGAVYLQSDVKEVSTRAKRYAIVFVLVLVGASTTAFLLSNKLQTTISVPLSHLAYVVKQVAIEKNYTVRAVKQGEDELGHLIDGFNEMLKQIQQRESALHQARDELEERVAERTRELANSLSLLNATIDSSADGIIAFQFNGGTICYNSQYQRLWNVPDAIMKKHNNDDLIAWAAAQVKDSKQFLARIAQMMACRETDSFDVIELKDGRTLERYVKPQNIDGRQVGAVINFRDITARKLAERELEDAHKRLLESSRQAGMAEVATGVLHNVGNVLNSVNVSANLVIESIMASKVAGLAKVAALLHAHRHDLGEFISHDAKGKHLAIYLQQLCEHLQTEQQVTVKELDILRSNIDHIKQIVSMQQSYAKVSGVKEVVNVIDLLEDTLHMNSGALQRHGVQVIREFDAVPLINTDKHKILQVLVNLVRNAKYACSESGRSDKCMTLRVSSNDTHIQIAAIDNGIGIAPENLTRVFGHGFTTRKDGHGFGLHSGALAARELGGSLHAHSAGIGHGATFILELPLDTVAQSKCLSA